jgi:hypothetical protein
MTLQNFSLDKLGKVAVRSASVAVVRPTASRAGAADLGFLGTEPDETNQQTSRSAALGFGLSDYLMSASEGSDGTLTLADVLLRAQVFATDRAKREELALSLLLEGITAEDVAVVAHRALFGATNQNAAIGGLVNLLRDKPRLRKAIEDCRELLRFQAGVVKRWHPGEIDRQRTAQRLEHERKDWEAEDRAHYLACRIRDGVPEAVAEAEYEQRKRSR